METTATYIPEKKVFVMDSPTITSTKFYPGGLGKSANFAFIMARVKSNWRDHGVHGFVVQIRDLESHVPLQGIEVGDIGQKMAF
jgi:acyl-CoA oxidase